MSKQQQQSIFLIDFFSDSVVFLVKGGGGGGDSKRETKSQLSKLEKDQSFSDSNRYISITIVIIAS